MNKRNGVLVPFIAHADHQDWYRADEVETELARLRERVAELEQQVIALTPDFQHALQLSEAWEEREGLLLEAVRWLCIGVTKAELDEIPTHLAPLIAEATKEPTNG